MSAWVVTPQGVQIKYDAVSQVRPQADGSLWLYRGDHFIAMAPAGSVVSYVEPAALKLAPRAAAEAIESALEVLTLCGDRLTEWRHRRRLNDLKRTLARFDGRTGQWKPEES